MTWNVSLGFGSGVMFVTPSGGSPLRVGVMQDVSFDISFDQKPLYGQNQWPIALARGKAKGSIKAKTAQIDSGVIGTLILGGTPVPNQNIMYDLEAHAVPANPGPYLVTVNNHLNPITDLGVFYATTGQQLTQVAAGAEAAGKYSYIPATGTYTFAAADQGAAILVSYETAATSGFVTTLTNQLMGTVNYFQTDLYQNNPEVAGSQWGMRLYRCASEKLALATKQDDWIIPEFDATVQANAAGKVLDFNTPT
jgi:hypothetical protein